MKQKTISSPVSFSGKGLHFGEEVTITLLPAPINHGITFEVSGEVVKGSYQNVKSTFFNTTISSPTAKVSTAEHLLAALFVLDVTNVLIVIEGGSEIPIVDGGSSLFYFGILSAGVDQQDAEMLSFHPKSEVLFESGESSILWSARDDNELSVTIEVDFPVLGSHTFKLDISGEAFYHKVAFAKTFASIDEVNKLREIGYAKGGDEHCAYIYGSDDVSNENAKIFEHDFAIHKMLDFLGDISLYDGKLRGNFYCKKVGHRVNNEFLWHIASNNLQRAV